MKTASHIVGLDGIRGVAVLLVVGFHVSGVFYGNSVSWLSGGFLGVDIFFVLSGFLIAWMLHNDQLRSKGLRVKRFYSRRFIRLAPAMAFLLFFQILYILATHQSKRLELQVLTLIGTNTLNYGWYFNHSLVPLLDTQYLKLAVSHLWSISLEVHYYLIAPVIIATIASVRRSRWISIGSVTALIAAIGISRYELFQSGTSVLQIYTRTDTRIDSFLVGLLLELTWQHFSLPRVITAPLGWTSLIFLAVMISTVHNDFSFLSQGGYTLVAISTACVMFSVLTDSGPARLFRFKPLRGLGRVSYGLYLWHLFVFSAVLHWCHDRPRLLQIMLALTISALATWISWRFIEQPLLARRSA